MGLFNPQMDRALQLIFLNSLPRPQLLLCDLQSLTGMSVTQILDLLHFSSFKKVFPFLLFTSFPFVCQKSFLTLYSNHSHIFIPALMVLVIEIFFCLFEYLFFFYMTLFSFQECNDLSFLSEDIN